MDLRLKDLEKLLADRHITIELTERRGKPIFTAATIGPMERGR